MQHTISHILGMMPSSSSAAQKITNPMSRKRSGGTTTTTGTTAIGEGHHEVGGIIQQNNEVLKSHHKSHGGNDVHEEKKMNQLSSSSSASSVRKGNNKNKNKNKNKDKNLKKQHKQKKINNLKTKSAEKEENVILTTKLGDIHIQLRPDLSLESVQYIQNLINEQNIMKPCDGCRFYRAEKPGILQGIIRKDGVDVNKVLGDCPKEFQNIEVKNCPPHDPNCGCHGPIMERGMVGWAAGLGGPDFFIDMYESPAKFWGNQHTIWGQIVEDESLKLVDSLFDLPATKSNGGLTFLDEALHFEIHD